MAIAFQNHDGQFAQRLLHGFGYFFEILCGGDVEVDRGCRFWAYRDFFHVHAWPRVKHGAAFRNRNYGDCVSSAHCRQRGAIDWVDCHVGQWLRAVSNPLTVVQHGGFVFFAFANNNNAVHADGVEHVAHCVDCCAVGGEFVATPNPARCCECGRFGYPNQFHCKVAVGKFSGWHHP